MLVAAVALAFAGGCAQEVKARPTTETVEIAGERFTLELAIDPAARTRGLMGRREIAPQGGMLFIFPRPDYQRFWMANCLVDIDLIFLDPQGRVTAAHRMKVEPARRDDESEIAYQTRLRGYPSVYPAQFAIELAAGSIDRLGIRVERKIALDLERLKALAH
jgi:uncharacterized membrane protein (UPF0127 family)